MGSVSFESMKRKLSFSIEIIQEEDAKGFYVVVPALPGCFSQGKTIEEAKKNILQAICLHIKELKKSGEKIPQDVVAYQTNIQVAA